MEGFLDELRMHATLSDSSGEDPLFHVSDPARTAQDTEKINSSPVLEDRLPSGRTIHEITKPFGCPFTGCQKRYKNRNGLKYHEEVSCRATETHNPS